MQRSRVELETYNGEDDYRKQHQQANLQQWRHRLDDGLQNHLQTYIHMLKVSNISSDVGIIDDDWLGRSGNKVLGNYELLPKIYI